MTTSKDLLGIELLVQCSSCGATVPITRPVQQDQCSHCLGQTEVDEAAWGAVLRNLRNDFGRLGRGVLDQGKLDRPGRDVEWERGPDRPPCDRCGKPMQPAPGGQSIGCNACRHSRPVQSAPAWLRAAEPAVVGFVADADDEPATEQRTLGLSCTQCGSSLSTDGSARTVPCPYCNTTNILPDDVWRALHPPKRRKRFWLLVDLDPDPRQVLPNLGAEARFWYIASPLAGLLAGLALGPPLGTALMAILGILTTVTEAEGGMFLLLTGLAVAGLISLLGCGRALLRWLKLRSIVKAEQEVLGRLIGHGDKMATVALERPGAPGAELARVQRKVAAQHYQRLGGDGGFVRAWIVPGTQRTEVRFTPSGMM